MTIVTGVLSLNYTVLVIGKGYNAYRWYHLEELYQAGLAVWLVDDDKVSDIELGLLTEFWQADFNADASWQAVQLAEKLSLPADTVGICYIESLLPWAAEFFLHLKVQFMSVRQASLVRSKYELRRAFEAAGLPTPDYGRGSPEELLALDTRFPVIVKPERGYSSIGVELILSRANLVAYFARDNNVRADSYVIESVIDGDEYSIEGYISDDKVTASGLTVKFKTPRPYFEELGHYCSRSISLTDTHRNVFEQAVRSVGISCSPFHFEFIVNSGMLTPVEIGARPAGDKIPYLHRRVSGRSILLDYLGIDQEFPTVASEGLGIVFFVPSSPGTISSHFPSERLSNALGEHSYEAYPGKMVKTAPDDFFVRLGFCLVEANSVNEFAARANERIALFERDCGVPLHRIAEGSC